MKETQKFINSMISVIILFAVFIVFMILIHLKFDNKFLVVLSLFLAAFIAILFVCGIIKEKNKNGETLTKFTAVSSIGPIAEGSSVTITIRPDELYIYSNNNENISASLAIHKVTGVSTLSKTDVINKKTSFGNRAFWGGMFFGLWGALLGGMSAMNGKTKTVNTNLISIGYTSDEGQQEFILLKILPFQAWAPFIDEVNSIVATSKKTYNL